MNELPSQLQKPQAEFCPFVRKARDKYYYIAASSGIFGPFIDLIIKLSQGLVWYQALALIMTALANIMSITMFYHGYQTFSRIFSSCVYYSYVATLLFDPNETLYSPIILVCCSITIRNHFLYDKERWKTASFLLMIGDVTLLVAKAFLFLPKDSLVVTRDSIKSSLLSNIAPVVVCLVGEMYFDGIRQGVFNELKGYSDGIEQATKDKETFFACMSHEIRNPLQSLLSSVELLQHSESPEQRNSCITIIKSGCEVVLNLVSNILDVSKIEAQKMEFAPTPASLNENVSKIVRLLSDKAKGKSLTLSYHEDTPLPPCLLFDPHRLHQVIINLVSNAVKFTQKGKVLINVSWIPLGDTATDSDRARAIQNELSVSNWKSLLYPLDELDDQNADFAKRQLVCSPSYYPSSAIRSNEKTKKNNEPKSNPDHSNACTAAPSPPPRPAFTLTHGLVKIEVIDTGIGIDKSSRRKLFKPYQQADASISQNYGGTGLGLWISQSIIRLMGGDIAVKSKVGAGTNMIVVFPSQTCPETAVVEGNSMGFPILKAWLKGKRCLVLDDIPENTFLLQGLLQNSGLCVTAKNRAREALDAVIHTNPPFDLIITDLRMPEMSGQEFILAVRNYEKTLDLPRTPILVLTGESGPGEKMTCLSRYGADEFLLKPVKLFELMNSVEKLLAPDKKLRGARNVLLIDDDCVSQKVLSGIISQNGNVPKSCMTIADAKSEFAENGEKYGLILLDNELPDGKGLDFMEFYRNRQQSLHAKTQVAIICMSGNCVSDQQRMYHEYKDQIQAFFQKPISKAMLLDIIKSIR